MAVKKAKKVRSKNTKKKSSSATTNEAKANKRLFLSLFRVSPAGS